MKILLLGVGMQGKAALHDLVNSNEVKEVIAADSDINLLKTYIENMEYGDKVRCEYCDAANPESINLILKQKPDVIVDLLPVPFHTNVVRAAIKHGIHLVYASYATPEIKKLAAEAAAQNVIILPEFGMDPGIDLVLLGEAVRSLDSVEEIISYGSGFPEPRAADNPLKYKVTWTFEGVLKSYRRAARIISDGKPVKIKETELFYPGNIHEIEIEGLGRLEAFPNGNILNYADLLDIKQSNLKNMGRYVLRWPGHCAFWKKMIDLHFLDDEPVIVNGTPVDRKRYLASLIEPQIQYAANERDVVVVRVEATGRINGQRKHAVYQLIDRRDLKTGLTAMSRTVGFTASIGAQMIGTGKITKRGVLSPTKDVPYQAFVDELKKRDIQITSTINKL